MTTGELKKLNEGTPCSHRWVIEEARGQPQAEGRCSLCGATRTFRNRLPNQGDEDTEYGIIVNGRSP